MNVPVIYNDFGIAETGGNTNDRGKKRNVSGCYSLYNIRIELFVFKNGLEYHIADYLTVCSVFSDLSGAESVSVISHI